MTASSPVCDATDCTATPAPGEHCCYDHGDTQLGRILNAGRKSCPVCGEPDGVCSWVGQCPRVAS